MTSPADDSAFADRTSSLVGDAVVWTDADERIIAWNPAAERLYGWSAAEAIGQPISLIVPVALWEHVEELHRRVGEGDVVRDIETVHRRSDETHFRVLLTTAPVRAPDGRVMGIVRIAQDLSGQQRTDREARRLAAIVRWSDDAIVSKDLNGIVTTWNVAAERMFGYTAAEMIGTSIRVLIPEDRQSEEDETLARIRRGDTVEHFETLRRRKDGTIIVIALTVSPIRNAFGEVVGASKIARDITKMKEIENERQRLLESVQEISRLKDEFVATLSHELRTPLNAILGYARMLRSGVMAPDRLDQAIQVIERNAAWLSRMVDDVLDISRIITGKMRLTIQRVELGPIVRTAIDGIQPAATAKGIRVEFSDEGAAPIAGDPERLQQILWNLLSNAVKFTSRGGLVRVGLRQAEASAEISVVDNGDGIAPEFLPYIFERFRQADSTGTRERSGLGLGLAIVRQLVEAHGGAIEASSEGTGQGAAFRILLPVADHAASIAAPADPHDSATAEAAPVATASAVVACGTASAGT
jgi:PAS domain S-box-containing protein